MDITKIFMIFTNCLMLLAKEHPQENLWPVRNFSNRKPLCVLQYYRAMIDAVDAQTDTAVVTFLDYGNTEKVSISDITLASNAPTCMVQAPGVPSSMPGFLVQGPPQVCIVHVQSMVKCIIYLLCYTVVGVNCCCIS